jgi:uncharacterized protein YcaQ
MEASLSWDQVHAWRMHAQGLVERASRRRRLAVVSSICGLHAQVMSSAELTLWARVEGLRAGDVSQALWRDRKLVKTWAMRGTLHLLPASEVGLWVGALATADEWRKPSWFKAFGFTPDGLERLIAAAAEALDGRELTREELAAEVARESSDPGLAEKLAESWGSSLKPAAFRGLLCFGPDRGRNVTFTSPASWLEEFSPTPPGEALRTVARRWLGAFGPASREDLARWWGWISPARAGKLLASLEDEVAEVDVEGSPQLALASSVSELAAFEPARVVRLVPAFDQYVVGVPRKGPGAPFAAADRARIYRQAGWLSPSLLVDGRIEGVWKHELKGGALRVEVDRFAGGRVPKWLRDGVAAEAERLAEFLGGEPKVSWA